ncbi:Ppx/GppA family phosphatase [Streptomyces sp. RKND-216]|uniref:Ppx/GppA phosphatase family protein n=1 Tax=Streptomyces sp. RKND-216 TaxID=2562581 RepID=UPI00109E03F7|nr:Ppx/GppA family phosphatase [Streptomyces sp. RKND-216]THA27174.1 Ppx/GppA family phosphatase [Streptomyces sp. RKND-216]
MRVGVLDAGSNTVRLEVADLDGAVPTGVHTAKQRLRLAELVERDGRLPSCAITLLADAVADARKEAESWGVADLDAFATAIIRDAPNRDEVLNAVLAETGLELRVMSGEREAELTFLAARAWMGWRAGPMVVLDIGGGSLEIAFGGTGVPDFAASMPLGAGRLTRRYFGRADPPPKRAVKAVRCRAEEQLREVSARVRAAEPLTAVATSRTFQQLARLCGAPPAKKGVHVPRELSRADLRKAVTILAGLPAAERAKLPGISRPRSRQALAGAVVAHTAMRQLDLASVTVCPWAVREGLLLQRLAELER